MERTKLTIGEKSKRWAYDLGRMDHEVWTDMPKDQRPTVQQMCPFKAGTEYASWWLHGWKGESLDWGFRARGSKRAYTNQGQEDL